MLCGHRITESLRLERLLRSLSPAINLAGQVGLLLPAALLGGFVHEAAWMTSQLQTQVGLTPKPQHRAMCVHPQLDAAIAVMRASESPALGVSSTAAGNGNDLPHNLSFFPGKGNIHHDDLTCSKNENKVAILRTLRQCRVTFVSNRRIWTWESSFTPLSIQQFLNKRLPKV